MAVEPRRALVTGGAGFIGSHVVQELLSRDYDVAALDNLRTGNRERVPEGATFHEVDIRASALRSVVNEVDPSIVIHLAALHSTQYCAEHVEEALDVNVFGTRNLLAAVRDQHNVQRVVLASSASVYPPIEEPIQETLGVGPTDVVGKTKVIGEDLVHLFNEETGVPAAAARLFEVYGPTARNPMTIQSILEQARAGVEEIRLRQPAKRRDFVHVEDAARAILELGTHDWGYRTYNVASGHAYTGREVAQLVNSLLDREVEIVEHEGIELADSKHLEADISRISEEIGWEPSCSLPDEIPGLLEGVGFHLDSGSIQA